MSVVSLLGVRVLNNPAKFTDKYEFEITFECLEQLQKDLEWKLTYVGSATSDQYDQELDDLLVGPIPVGVNKFIFEAGAPDTTRIPDADILGVTVILLTCAYDGREFIRVGYYVNNEYDLEELNAEPPSKPIIERVRRNILSEKPRVTRFAIKWDSDASAPAEFPPEQPEADLAADEDEYGAEEREEEEADANGAEGADANANGENKVAIPAEDSEMAGVETENGQNGEADKDGKSGKAVGDAEEDEVSDDGSVDIEGESEDDLEDEELAEGEVEGDAMDEDVMDVDAADKVVGAAAPQVQPTEIKSH
ncbi:Histone chaperone ASF1 like protein [Verticillium longisporum]|uniref:Anti-silencing function protein 1 n=4 Tax=Verticillium TaxID=1036719 RepID=G2XI61_VERDV|nr:histone chaperone ASF1 [Verticillium dahliae VdLs.17]KAF3347336.1 ATP-dependent RNA helicase FAL1 [Verticillium dahliae VDG2]KAF3360852.1 ATP-dependent RNA helicase DBP10 [Verticillium dahliae VDG1]KAG7134622.1 Histone chaperone ASF1 like protein [Verticillium longisporum]KAH6701822.1 histone chaperone ASF1 [Verticillium dahliae]EGY19509.1 histone chaperone ASF1 [Verticillium dahliae VdLs.17]